MVSDGDSDFGADGFANETPVPLDKPLLLHAIVSPDDNGAPAM